MDEANASARRPVRAQSGQERAQLVAQVALRLLDGEQRQQPIVGAVGEGFGEDALVALGEHRLQRLGGLVRGEAVHLGAVQDAQALSPDTAERTPGAF
jgi:hypothetical protein